MSKGLLPVMRFPLGKEKAFTMSYDDGVEQDIRLIDIMQENGLKGTFNINSGLFANEGTKYQKGVVHRRMTQKQCLELYKNSGQEIALHCLTHGFLDQIESGMISYEVLKDRENLEKMFGCIVKGMAYPYGRFSDKIVDVLKNIGVAYSRTIISTGRFDIPSDWLRLKPTCHHDDKNLFALADSFINDSLYCEPRLFYLWGHSYEFEQHNNWNVIEKFAKKIRKNDNIWYATNIEIYDYVKAYQRMEFSLDGKIARNISSIDLYFDYNDKIYEVKSGETIYLK